MALGAAPGNGIASPHQSRRWFHRALRSKQWTRFAGHDDHYRDQFRH